MIRIAAVNDYPVLASPLAAYTPPAACAGAAAAAASGAAALGAVPPECFFGPYWVREDTSDVLPIPGFAVSDADLLEESAGAALSTRISARTGIVDLNTRTNLNFFDQDARSRRGFTASQVAAAVGAGALPAGMLAAAC